MLLRLTRGWLMALPLVVAGALPAAALEGRVVDERTGAPVARAEVTILGRPGVVLTDGDGRFTWLPTPLPPFEIIVVLPGERYTAPFYVERLPAQGPLIVPVKPLLSETLAVTAGAAPDIESLPASGTTLLTASDLRVRQPATLAQALENVAGVATISEGQSGVPAIRGLARGRTLILIDGTRVTAERRVGPSATFLDPFLLDAIEVARGPGSVAYGSDAFGGVIYARTRRAELDEPWSVRALATLGAGTPEWRSGVEIGRGYARSGVLVQAHARGFGDYGSPRGEVLNSSAKDRGLALRGALQLGRGRLRGGYQLDAGRDVGRPRNNSATVRVYYPTEDSQRVTGSIDLDRAAGFDRVGVTTFVGTHRVVTDQDRPATPAAARRIERADVDAKDFQVRGSGERFVGAARLKAGLDVHGRFGLEATDAQIQYDAAGAVSATETVVSIDRARRTAAGVYLAAEAAPLPRLSLNGGVRVDRVTTQNRGGYFGDRATSHAAASGVAAASVGPFGGVTITGHVARGFRDPVLSDRYYRGPTGRGFITGEPDLDPERSLQIDLALRYTRRGLRLALHGYRYRIDNLVERYETVPDLFFYRNRGGARISGVEAEAQLMPAEGLTIELSASVARGTALERLPATTSTLDDIAPPTLTLVVRKALGTRAFVQVRGLVLDRDTRPGPTEVGTPGYGLLDAGGLRLTARLELRATARNLLDHAYPLSTDARATPAPGRAGSVTLLVSF